jgi:aminopeptidase
MSSLGEVALVPNSSPISRLGILFYNTLLDENATSHIALGDGVRFCMQDAESMSDEEYAARGGNSSLNHIDFMIGGPEMDVDGLSSDGSTEAVMRAGEWAFEV